MRKLGRIHGAGIGVVASLWVFLRGGSAFSGSIGKHAALVGASYSACGLVDGRNVLCHGDPIPLGCGCGRGLEGAGSALEVLAGIALSVFRIVI